MKKSVATFCLLGAATLALSACDSTNWGDVDSGPPYTQDRTASHGEATKSSPTMATPTRVAPAEKVFQRAQTK